MHIISINNYGMLGGGDAGFYCFPLYHCRKNMLAT